MRDWAAAGPAKRRTTPKKDKMPTQQTPVSFHGALFPYQVEEVPVVRIAEETRDVLPFRRPVHFAHPLDQVLHIKLGTQPLIDREVGMFESVHVQKHCVPAAVSLEDPRHG